MTNQSFQSTQNIEGQFSAFMISIKLCICQRRTQLKYEDIFQNRFLLRLYLTAHI